MSAMYRKRLVSRLFPHFLYESLTSDFIRVDRFVVWWPSVSILLYYYYYYYYYYYTIWISLVTGLFCLVLLLNQQWSPPLRLEVSHCSTFRIMCDVPSIAVFCSESIECFPGTASKFFLRRLVTIPVAPIITGIIVHFRFHILCISIHKLLYFNFFIIIIIIIIIIINCNWVVTRWQWLFYMYTKHEIGY